MVDLFTPTDYASNEFQEIEIQDAELRLYPNFFSEDEADLLLVNLEKEIEWRQEKIKMYGKQHDLPRLMAFYGDKELEKIKGNYTFSGIRKIPCEWTQGLMDIKQKIETVSRLSFNSVLANYYRDGNDSVAWHSDDEPELGKAPVIASISFGEVREFQLKHKVHKEIRHSFFLPHGSFILMSGQTQKYWLHQIPKRASVKGPRINLTYRTIKQM